ncbi:MAG TPA: TonB-dependent receptor [Hymenobacter sp.]|uniref:TonB-dependent receptor domain-containing protein n=1 Tax=Hymenobacter sp. TaxID=1898978 RepID=UPI002D7E853D|nr:TonB-dependent receptor [Hymenobacter sp.]HET9504333.1 TonB-dependent receptor [Hymenobacter sp.]
MNKHSLLPALLAATFSAPLLAQGQGAPGGARPATAAAAVPRPAGGRITGTVTEAATGKPVSYATVSVLDASGKSVNGGVAGDDGRFVLPGIPAGTYTVQVTFLGFKEESRPGVVVEPGGTVALGSITLGASAQALKEVVVTGRKQLIEERVDRTIYNADVDKTTAGGDATDVLKRVPLLSVDLDGNVSLRGSSNIRVLINNKPSTIAASSIADALKQIPADQIQTVEVITSPSAKYDAEGSGGIINIVLKKDGNLRGGSLGADVGAGLRATNLGLNGSYRTGKMGFSLGGFGRASYNQPGSFANDQTAYKTDGTPPSTNRQTADTRRNDIFGRYTLGWDWDIDKHNSLSASVAYGLRNSYNYQDRLTRVSSNAALNDVRNVKTTDESATVDASLNYTHTYETPQREFSILTLYSRNNRTNNFLNDILGGSDYATTSRRRNDNDSYNQEMTAQFDYQTPTLKNQLLELGVKDIYRRVNSEYAYFLTTGNNDNFVLDPTQEANNFNYRQNVASGYVTYTVGLPKGFTLKPGVRYEYTTINAEFSQGANKNPDIPNYGVLVPSVNLSRRFDNGNVLKLAYNRRIQRPSLQFLNPNRLAPNPLQATIGNPELQPEYTNNYELGYSTVVKQKVNLNMSAFMRNTRGSIQGVRRTSANGDTIITNYFNAGKEDAYGASLFASVNAGKLTLNGGVDSYYAVLDNQNSDRLYAARNTGFVVSGRAQVSYALSKQWAIQGFGFYRGQQVQLQGYQSGFGIYSLNIRRNFADGRGGIGFGAENFFTGKITIRNEVNTPLLAQTSSNVIHNLNFKVNLSYRIGKLTVDQRRSRKGVSNDDLKDGGGGGDFSGGDTGGQGGGGGRSGGGQGGGQRPTGAPAGAGQRPGAAGQRPGAPTDSTRTTAPADTTGGRPATAPANGTVPAPTQPADSTATPATQPAVKPQNTTAPVGQPSPGTTSPGGITPAGSPGGRP